MFPNLVLLFCISTKVTNSVPGFEFGDNRAAKYLTDDNGVAEITVQERIVHFHTPYLNVVIIFNCS